MLTEEVIINKIVLMLEMLRNWGEPAIISVLVILPDYHGQGFHMCINPHSQN